MTINWDAIADGRLHRIRRGRDFEGSPSAFRRAIKLEARRRQQPVQIGRDISRPDRMLWVQFGRATVRPGDLCTCGGQPEQVHAAWARCNECASLLAVAPQSRDEAIEKERTDPDDPLEELEDVVLYRESRTPWLERLVGHARDSSGRIVLLELEYPLTDGARLANKDGGFERRVRLMPAAPFGAAIDVTAMSALGKPVAADDDVSSPPDADTS
jgi:hypothetical protein